MPEKRWNPTESLTWLLDVYIAKNKCVHEFVYLFRCFKLIVDLKKNVYDLKACPIPYPMVGETFFVTIMNNVTTS